MREYRPKMWINQLMMQIVCVWEFHWEHIEVDYGEASAGHFHLIIIRTLEIVEN